MEQTVRVSLPRKIINIICIFLCVILSFMLIGNITIIVKGMLNPDRPPQVLGITPMVVLSGSMAGTHEGHIEVGDLIFIDNTPFSEIKEGDVISFMEGKTIVTHRAIQTISDFGETAFVTKGDANNAEDQDWVKEANYIGKYKGRIPYVGDFALFLQTPLGMGIFIGIPVLAFIIYDMIRRQKSAKKESQKTAELEAEIERLRKLANKEEEKEN